MSIIKCPECMGRISTMAGTCPHCGIAVAGQLIHCPQCGEYCLKSQQECPRCHTHLNSSPEQSCPNPKSVETGQQTLQIEKVEINPAAAEGPATEQEAEETDTKRSGRGAALVSVILTIVLLIGAWYFIESTRAVKKEEADFAALESVTNPEFYYQFLKTYPESIHKAEVEKRMNALLEEAKEWQEVLLAKSRIAILRFSQSHPNSIYQRTCADMIDSIDWREAQSLGTEEAINDYLNNHPEGLHAAEAAEHKNALALTRITTEDKQTIRGVFDTFFSTAMSTRDTTLVATFIPQAMENFCNITAATPAQIVEFAEKKVEEDVIGLHYIVGTDMNIRRETLANADMGFAVDFTLEETINRTNASKPTSHTYTVSAKMNATHKIVRMSIK